MLASCWNRRGKRAGQVGAARHVLGCPRPRSWPRGLGAEAFTVRYTGDHRSGRRIAALSGRVHFYEGYDLATVVFATRVMGRLGVRHLILTNAAGGINTALTQGALMIIDDHINMNTNKFTTRNAIVNL